MHYFLTGGFLIRRLWRPKTFVAGFLIFCVCASLLAPERGASAQGGCSVDCDATVPMTAQVSAQVQFMSAATATGCASAPLSYEWEFGDGTPTAPGQTVTHVYTAPGTYTWKLTTTAVAGAAAINTIAGGYGENAPARRASFTTPSVIARDPQGRGVYVIDEFGGSLIRFINTSDAPATIAGRVVAPGAVRIIAGVGTNELVENTPAMQTLIRPVGLGVSANGNLLFFSDDGAARICVINVSSSNVTIAMGKTIGPGNIRTFTQFDFSDPIATGTITGFAVHPTSGEVFFTDSGVTNKVFKVLADGSNLTTVAGNGATTSANDPLPQPTPPANATAVPLLVPRDIVFDSAGFLYIADTGHARVVRVDAMGKITLALQYDLMTTADPYAAGLAAIGGSVYLANGNQQTIVNVTDNGSLVAGAPGMGCDYSSSSCGDGGAGLNATFGLAGSVATPPLTGMESDASGLFILDQGGNMRGRVRYLNLSGAPVTRAGVTIATNNIDTIAGTGLAAPFDGGLAIGGALNFAAGVAIDSAGNLFIADTLPGLLRFVNRGSNAVTLFPNTPAQQIVGPGAIVTINKDVDVGPTDGVPVNQAGFDTPQGLFVTNQGVFIADSKGGPTVLQRRNGTIRFINTSPVTVILYPNSPRAISVPPGNIAKIVGGGMDMGLGDGGFALDARLIAPGDVAVNPSTRDIYIADTGNRAVRKVSGSTGIITNLDIPPSQYTGLGLDAIGRLYIADFDGNLVLRESSAGNGEFARLNPTTMPLNMPRDVAVDVGGAAYVTNSGENRIVRISPAGMVEPFAGTTMGFDGDGGSATDAKINISPDPVEYGIIPTRQKVPPTVNIATGPGGEVIFSDSVNSRVRRIASPVTTCVKTGTITITGPNPAPALASLNPASILVNSGGFTLTANGSGFSPASVVRWNGQDRTTTFISATQLNASIPASDLTSGGTAQVTVFSPAPGGGTSAALPFTVVQPNPVPSITSLSPTSAVEGTLGFTLTVNGTNFVNGSVVRLNDVARATTFVSATQVTAQIMTADLIGAGQVSVTVFNPAPSGGVSNVLQFNITACNQTIPVLNGIVPNSILAGSAAFALTLNGSGFTSSSRARFNNQELQTMFGGATQLVAQVPANLVASAGTAQVIVFTPAPGCGVSAAQTFTINASQGPAPFISMLRPTAVGVGSAGSAVTVIGNFFVNGSVARINGFTRATTFVSAMQLNVTLLAGDVANAGDLSVTVVNPAPSGGTTNAVALKVAPKVTSGNAASFATAQIAPESIVAAFGSGMATGTQIASAVPLPTTLLGTTVKVTDSAGTTRDAPLFFVSPLQINYLAPPGMANGPSTVVVSLNNNIVGAGPMTINRVAPGLFAANANAAGVASALVLRVRNGVQTFEPVVRFDTATSRFVPTAIDLGPPTDVVYLLLFGTGVRNRTSAGNISVNLGGTVKALNPAQFEDGFAVPGFAGLDQVNVLAPRALIGRGLINITLTVDGQTSNTVQLMFK
ncbi:MAG: PKD domain-containing protein [Blastocatellia bacterium]